MGIHAPLENHLPLLEGFFRVFIHRLAAVQIHISLLGQVKTVTDAADQRTHLRPAQLKYIPADRTDEHTAAAFIFIKLTHI